MKTVVITGSARGFGYEMLKLFGENNYNVVVVDVNDTSVKEAIGKLEKIKSKGKVLSYVCDITRESDVSLMIKNIKKNYNIDIWINNAGVNQPNEAVWDLDIRDINRIIDIDLKGTILCSNLVMKEMINQGFGEIYNVEGHGSNDNKILGLSIYGTAKRAITYFTEALAFEVKKKNLNILVGKIAPGIMITNFINTSLGDGKKIELDDKTKKVYNILGDYPETIAKYMVNKIINNKKNNVKFTWLTNRRAMFRFMTSRFNKKDYFKENK